MNFKKLVVIIWVALLSIVLFACGTKEKDLYQIKEDSFNYEDEDKNINDVNIEKNSVMEEPDEDTGIDLSRYLDLSAEQFVEKTGMELCLEHGEEGDYFIGYEERVELDFDDEGIFNFNILTYVEGYNFFGVEVGMDIEEANNLLKEQGLECQEQSNDYYVYYLDSKGFKKLYIQWDKEKVISIIYGYEGDRIGK